MVISKQLLRNRETLKHKLISLEKYASAVGGEEVSGLLSLDEVQCRILDYEQLLIEFNKIQTEIESKCDDDILHDQFIERDNFEDSFFKSLGILKRFINLNTSMKQEHAQSRPVHIHSDQTSFLPKIKLPVFKGDYENWLDFKTNFIAIVHNNPLISKVNKFNFLRTSLDGYAKRIVDGVEFTEEHYEGAWALLCERFDKKRVLVNNHLKAIFNLENIQRESAQAYRKLLDETSKHLTSIKNLKLSEKESADIYLMFLIISKLDKPLQKKWEEYKPSGDLPTLHEFFEFLNSKADALENWQTNQNIPSSSLSTRPYNSHNSKYNSFNKYYNHNFHKNQNSQEHTRINFATDIIKCNFCKEKHVIYNCREFLALNPSDRHSEALKLNLCLNCLRTGHNKSQCYFGSCKKCSKKHNTLLHIDNQLTNSNTTNTNTRAPVQEELSANFLVKPESNSKTHVLLSTVVIQVQGVHGEFYKCRAILDSGAQSNLITNDFSRKLGIPLTPTNLSIIGINQIVSNLNKKCTVTIASKFENFKCPISCYVVPIISSAIPPQVINISSWKIPHNINLADPEFNSPGEVDMLIGAGHFWDLLCDGKITLGKNLPSLHNSKLGWIISGNAPILNKLSFKQSVCNFSANQCSEDEQLKKFWELEEVSTISHLSQADTECERLFSQDTTRNEQGQFVVKMPLRHSISLLGDSIQTAIKRFYSLEKRFTINTNFKILYKEFIDEYHSLGHMHKIQGKVEDIVKRDINAYYLPHHGVLKENSLTTKLRVVFDGSCKTSTGWSLNDLQYTGPKIQNDIFNILLRFRTYTYVVSADVSKMYRQVLMHSEHQPLQRILWRDNPESDFSVYELNTVTYGTASAPYLAMKCLNQLALDHFEHFPKASETILNDFYVDDLLTGANDLNTLQELCQDISSILCSGNFMLRKWVSNNPQVVRNVNCTDIPNGTLSFSEHDSMKTLGIQWQSQQDLLTYSILDFKSNSDINSISKRQILSYIAQIYDPLGLLSPCIITAKIIIQKLWSLKLAWDDPIPANLRIIWKQFHSHLNSLNQLRIPRNVTLPKTSITDIHCFCDASKDAYAACIYVRSKSQNNNEYYTSLLCAKTKVAPIKTITIPRLELCAGLLGAQLVNNVTKALSTSVPVYYWSDSQVFLSWLKLEPNTLQVFVANRISKIQTLTNVKNWNYVCSKENPADLASRGGQPDKLLNSTIWWHGPSFLKFNVNNSVKEIHIDDLPELKQKVSKVLVVKNNDFDLISKFSNLTKLKNVTAYITRFIKNTKINKEHRNFGPLTAAEQEYAWSLLLKLSQAESFEEEIHILKSKEKLPKNHKLSSFTPFLDQNNILRVGGRLKFTSLNYDIKHPILLHSNHTLTKLIFHHKHNDLLHAGPQLLLSSIRQQYWPIGGRNLAKMIVRDCITCFKVKPLPATVPMAGLPDVRIKPTLPFQNTGIDYAGPYYIKDRKGRRSNLIKCYICIFICFCTKAVHLELVSDLTTETFLASFRRFTSRRGLPSNIYSDNGSTFIGAHNELNNLGKFLIENHENLIQFYASDGITWHFTPPYSPNFGGLWEAAVKSMKYHLKRTVMNAKLTFEELNTLLVQVEGILNSRPLFALSDDPNDLNPITPSHFLIGRVITAPPDADVETIHVTRLSRLDHIQQLQQKFWNCFSKHYITQFHQQFKWKEPATPLSVGTLVLIKNEHLPSFKWAIGRVSELFKGRDGISRVALVKVLNGTIKRAVRNLYPLPLQKQVCDEH